MQLGSLRVDHVDRAGALAAVTTLIASRSGGRVFTPNLDHVRLAGELPAFRDAYTRVALSVADGMPLVWMSRWLGTPLPERVSGADLVEPLCAIAAARGWRVFLLGGEPGVADEAAARLRAQHGTDVVGCLAPRISIDDTRGDEALIEAIRAARADVVFVSLGSPKQELWIDRVADALHPAVLLGVGAGIDFVAGRHTRAPLWMRRIGLEWFFRLCNEPGRLWRRYLVAGPRAVWYLLRTPRGGASAGAVSSLSRSSPDGP